MEVSLLKIDSCNFLSKFDSKSVSQPIFYDNSLCWAEALTTDGNSIFYDFLPLPLRIFLHFKCSALYFFLMKCKKDKQSRAEEFRVQYFSLFLISSKFFRLAQTLLLGQIKKIREVKIGKASQHTFKGHTTFEYFKSFLISNSS